MKYSSEEANMALKTALATWRPGQSGPASKPAAIASAAERHAATAPTEATPTAPVPAEVSGEAAEIAAAAAEATDKVSLTNNKASLAESSGIMSQAACALKAPWTPLRPD